MEYHKKALQNLCRLCCRKKARAHQKRPAKLCINYASDIQDFYGIRVDKEDSLVPEHMCYLCYKRMRNAKNNAVRNNPEIDTFKISKIQSYQCLWKNHIDEELCPVCELYSILTKGGSGEKPRELFLQQHVTSMTMEQPTKWPTGSVMIKEPCPTDKPDSLPSRPTELQSSSVDYSAEIDREQGFIFGNKSNLNNGRNAFVPLSLKATQSTDSTLSTTKWSSDKGSKDALDVANRSPKMTPRNLIVKEQPTKGGVHEEKVKIKTKKDFTQKKEYKCQICAKFLSNKTSLTCHMRTHNMDNKYTCDICNRSLTDAYTLERHKKSHGSLRPFQCNKCAFLAKTKDTLRNHMERHVAYEDRKHVCVTCQRKFKNKCDLTQHCRKIHDFVTDKQCPKCKITFESRFEWRKHKERHKEGLIMYGCNTCDVEFKTTSALANHMKTCSHSIKRSCRICKKKFHTRKALYKHRKVAHDGMLHQCEQCFQYFKKRIQLIKHGVEEHGNDWPLQCVVCQKGFPWKAGLERHQKEAHHVKTITNRRCVLCSKHFDSPLDLIRHRVNEHGKTWPVKCVVCGKGYLNSAALKGHLNCAHQVKTVGPLTSNISRDANGDNPPILNSEGPTCRLPFDGTTGRVSDSNILYMANNTEESTIQLNRLKVENATKENLFNGSKQIGYNTSDQNNMQEQESQMGEQTIEHSTQENLSQIGPHLIHENKIRISKESYKAAQKSLKTAFKNLNKKPFNQRFTMTLRNRKLIKYQSQNKDCAHKKLPQSTETRKAPKKNDEHKCKTCAKVLSSKTSLVRHMRTHGADNRYTCDICNKSLTDAYTLERHKKSHGSLRRFKCTKCEFSAKTRDTLHKHMDRHITYEERKYVCGTCQRKFKSKCDLAQHNKQVHGFVTDKHCSKCNITFESRFEWRKHIDRHKAKLVTYGCNTCDTELKSPSTLANHMKTCSHSIKRSCRICKKKFHTRKALYKHRKVAHDGMLHQCEQCFKYFKKRLQLIKHRVEEHGKDWPVKCVVCQKGFPWISWLQSHQKQAHQVRVRQIPIPLEMCGNWPEGFDKKPKHGLKKGKDLVAKSETKKNTFPKRSNLEQILKHTHFARNNSIPVQTHGPLPEGIDKREDPAKPVKDLLAKCAICKASFPNILELKQHVKHIHQYRKSSTPMQTCDLCSESFCTRLSLITHRVNVHGKDWPMKCIVCAKGFPTRSGLDGHLKSSHQVKIDRAPIGNNGSVLNNEAQVFPPFPQEASSGVTYSGAIYQQNCMVDNYLQKKIKTMENAMHVHFPGTLLQSINTTQEGRSTIVNSNDMWEKYHMHHPTLQSLLRNDGLLLANHSKENVSFDAFELSPTTSETNELKFSELIEQIHPTEAPQYEEQAKSEKDGIKFVKSQQGESLRSFTFQNDVTRKSGLRLIFPSQMDNKHDNDKIKTEPLPHPSNPGSGSAQADYSLHTVDSSGIKTEPLPHPSNPGSGSAQADGSLHTVENSGIKEESTDFNSGAKIKTEPPSQLNIIGEIIYESPIKLNHVISEFKTESPAQLNGELKREAPSHPYDKGGSKLMVYYMDSGEIKME